MVIREFVVSDLKAPKEEEVPALDINLHERQYGLCR
jgi:hypothetical protein